MTDEGEAVIDTETQKQLLDLQLDDEDDEMYFRTIDIQGKSTDKRDITIQLEKQSRQTESVHSHVPENLVFNRYNNLWNLCQQLGVVEVDSLPFKHGDIVRLEDDETIVDSVERKYELKFTFPEGSIEKKGYNSVTDDLIGGFKMGLLYTGMIAVICSLLIISLVILGSSNYSILPILGIFLVGSLPSLYKTYRKRASLRSELKSGYEEILEKTKAK